MGMIRNLRLRHQSFVLVRNSLQFAARLRSESREFTPGIWQSIDAMGDELAALARDVCPNERERRSLVLGLESALRACRLSDLAQVQIISRLAPRIMAGEPLTDVGSLWRRMAV